MVRATFSVNTPLFLGGAAPQGGAPELRPPSIKGVLRFWWRALAWSRHAGNLAEIRKEEARLFGAAGDNRTGGQASFLLRVRSSTSVRIIPVDSVLNGSDGTVVGDGARYFGYGLMEAFGSKKTGKKAGQLTRACLHAPFDFTVELIGRETLDKGLIDALKLMGLVGGLGSRMRRGWGSLSLLSLDGADQIWSASTDCESYRQALLDVIGSARQCDREPPYSAIWQGTRIEVVQGNADPLRLLNRVGEEMIRYRSWGRNGQILKNQASEKNFEDDHDWSKNPEGAAIPHPRRVIFGLPHNYSKTLGVTAEHYDRRASPLLVHVQRLTPSSHVAVISVLHSEFLPNGERLKVTSHRNESAREAAPDWSVLDSFVDRFRSPTKVLP